MVILYVIMFLCDSFLPSFVSRAAPSRASTNQITAGEAEEKYKQLYSKAMNRIHHLKEMHTTELCRIEAQHAALEQDAWRRLHVETEQAAKTVGMARMATARAVGRGPHGRAGPTSCA